MSGNVQTQVSENEGSTRGALPLPQEVDGGNKKEVQYRLFTMTFANGNTLANFAVFDHKTSTSDADFHKNREYWYVNTGYLGDLSSQNLSISFTNFGSGSSFSPPTAGQKFHRKDGDSWTAISTSSPDPLAGQGSLYMGTDTCGNTVYIRFVEKSGGSKLGEIAWYQLIAANANPARIAPNGTFTRKTSNAGVTAPQGQSAYYCIENA